MIVFKALFMCEQHFPENSNGFPWSTVKSEKKWQCTLFTNELSIRLHCLAKMIDIQL